MESGTINRGPCSPGISLPAYLNLGFKGPNPLAAAILVIPCLVEYPLHICETRWLHTREIGEDSEGDCEC